MFFSKNASLKDRDAFAFVQMRKKHILVIICTIQFLRL